MIYLSKIKYQDDKYTVIDISTKAYKDIHTIIDTFNYDKIKEHSLTLSNQRGKFYVQIFVDGKQLYLHRFLLDASDDKEVDHIDNNSLINIVSNMRLCSSKENTRNKHSDGIKGVYSLGKRWRAKIMYNGKSIHLGMFDTKQQASVAYNSAATILFG